MYSLNIILILSLIVGALSQKSKSKCNKNYTNIINSYIKNFGKDIYVNHIIEFYKTEMNLTDIEVNYCLNKKL